MNEFLFSLPSRVLLIIFFDFWCLADFMCVLLLLLLVCELFDFYNLFVVEPIKYKPVDDDQISWQWK